MAASIGSDGSIQLDCPRCGADIEAGEVNVAIAVAKCTACRTVFSFADQLSMTARPAPTGRAEVPLPPSIRVDTWGEELSIVWRWFTWKILFLVFFCIAWDGFLVFWYGTAMGFGPAAPTAVSLIMILFPIGHVAIGVGLTYATIASLFNKTVIRVAGGALTVRHGPIPWRGNRDIPAAEVEQVYCTEKTSHSSDHGTSRTYDVNAMRVDGRKVRLVGGFENTDQALYIEQAIEDHLGIPDRPVGGELPR